MNGGVVERRRRGVDLAPSQDYIKLMPKGYDRTSSERHTYRVEVWTDEPESGGEMIETISHATDFSVSCAAWKASIRARPGKVIIHLNGRHRMSCERAPDPPVPEFRRPLRFRRRPQKKRSTGCPNGTCWSALGLRADGAAL